MLFLLLFFQMCFYVKIQNYAIHIQVELLQLLLLFGLLFHIQFKLSDVYPFKKLSRFKTFNACFLLNCIARGSEHSSIIQRLCDSVISLLSVREQRVQWPHLVESIELSVRNGFNILHNEPMQAFCARRCGQWSLVVVKPSKIKIFQEIFEGDWLIRLVKACLQVLVDNHYMRGVSSSLNVKGLQELCIALFFPVK